MALTSLSDGVRIPQAAANLGIAGKILCSVVGIPASRLSLASSGVQDLRREDAEALYAALRKMAAIAQAVQPLPLSFANAEVWRGILKEFQNVEPDAVRAVMSKIFNHEGRETGKGE